MRSIFFFIIIISGLLSSSVSYAECRYAPDQPGVSASRYLAGCADGNAVSVSSGTDISATKQLVISVGEKAMGFAALFAIGAIVFAGIQYTTSYGDDEKVKKAKMTGIYALIGLILSLTAFALVDIIINFIYEIASR